MATKVKVLDIDLIRSFGGSVITMDDNKAKTLEMKKKVKIMSVSNDKNMDIPERNKMIWNPPKEKIFNNIKVYPDIKDSLFPDRI